MVRESPAAADEVSLLPGDVPVFLVDGGLKSPTDLTITKTSHKKALCGSTDLEAEQQSGRLDRIMSQRPRRTKT